MARSGTARQSALAACPGRSQAGRQARPRGVAAPHSTACTACKGALCFWNCPVRLRRGCQYSVMRMQAVVVTCCMALASQHRIQTRHTVCKPVTRKSCYVSAESEPMAAQFIVQVYAPKVADMRTYISARTLHQTLRNAALQHRTSCSGRLARA